MSQNRFPHLFSPITVRGKTFKNRILLAPKGYPSKDMNCMDKAALDFYERLAAGGAARINTGECDVQYKSAVSSSWNMFLNPLPESLCASVRQYAENCHKHGALAFMHFGHMGAYCRDFEYNKKLRESGRVVAFDPPRPPAPRRPDGSEYEPAKAYGPCETIINEPWDGITEGDVYDCNDGKHVNEMTPGIMNEIADAFAQCAANAKASGLDGMSIHSGHGFIFSQWVSRRFNKRTDEYGGCMENRARFPIMCLKRIRERVGEDFIVEMRFSADESIDAVNDCPFLDELVTVDEAVEFFCELDKYPGLLDIAHISGGLHFVPYYNTRVITNSFFPAAPNLEAAAKIKAAVKNIKVACVGAMGNPGLCEDAIADGKVDFVVLARQLYLADPEFPNKAEHGDVEDIDNCLRCAVCRMGGSCAVNPVDLNSEAWDHAFPKSAAPKKVVIIGGGIAGMKAAEFANRCGHKVVLFEKRSELGGILCYADNDIFKEEIKRFRHSMSKRIQHMDIDLRMNTEATPELVREEDPDVVIFAGGGRFRTLEIPGGNSTKVLDSMSCYLEPEKVSRSVAVIGGGLTGIEAAIHLAHQGKEVALISRSEKLAPRVKSIGPANGNIDTQLIWLDKLGVRVFRGYSAVRIVEEGLYIRKEGQEEIFLPSDTIVNTTGLTNGQQEAFAFLDCAQTVKMIGDCVRPGFIGDAVRGAYETVLSLG